MLSIGALARATGIGVETLRTWERRYGFPTPARKPSGHRLYPTTSVPRLRRIVEALAHGHRASNVVTASDDELGTLLGVAHAAALAAPAPAPDPQTLLAFVRAFDGEALTRALASEWGRLGPLPFLEQRIAPLVRAVGDAWAICCAPTGSRSRSARAARSSCSRRSPVKRMRSGSRWRRSCSR